MCNDKVMADGVEGIAIEAGGVAFFEPFAELFIEDLEAEPLHSLEIAFVFGEAQRIAPAIKASGRHHLWAAGVGAGRRARRVSNECISEVEFHLLLAFIR